MTLCTSAFSSSRSYRPPAASLTSCTRWSTTAAFHAKRSGSVPPRRKGDTRQADDVGFFRGEGEELRTVAANENGRVRLLHGQRIDGVVGHSIVSTGERDTFAREQTPDDDDRLRQAFDPRAS